MSESANFRTALEEAVLERHCANHPMTEKWAAGELSRNCLKGIAVEHWHWIKNAARWNFPVCAKAPRDVVALQLENYQEENDVDRPHTSIILRFAEVNGADLDQVRASPGLPTTLAWANWLVATGEEQPWWCGIAAMRVGTESQSPMLYRKVLPALREIYKYDEDEIEHFWLHSEVDVEHGVIRVNPKPLPYHQRTMVHLAMHLESVLDDTFVVIPDADWRFDDNEKAPDVAVYRTGEATEERPQVHAPVLAVEMLSPSNRDTERLVELYLGAGAATVWLIDADKEEMTEVGETRRSWFDDFDFPRRIPGS